MDVAQLIASASRWVQALSGNQPFIRMTQNGSIAVGDVEGEGDEATVAGLRSSFGFQASVTGIAPVQAIPSTAAQWFLYNPVGNTTTAFIDELGVALVSGTAGAGILLLGAKISGGQLPSSLPTANASHMAMTNRGSSARVSPLLIQSGVTLQAGPNALDVIAETVATNTAILSVDCANRDIRGKIAIQPGTGYALYVCSPAGTSPLYAPFGTFREYQSPQNAA